MGVDDDRPRQLAAGQDLDRKLEPAGDALGEEHLGRDRAVDLQLSKSAEIDDLPRRPVDVGETALVRHPLLDRQLAALESTPHAGTAARLLALGAAAGGLALAAAVAAADALAFSVRALAAAQIIQV